ncbi:MAG: DUF1592 domain-containing protein [Gammaproteobacteria bacterium]|jgi:hypothetical protein|nr:DUF1592 domain-containing protein [Gammaproteobacteria bacterium]
MMTLPMFNLQFPRLTLVLSSILALAPFNTIQAQEQALQAMANGDAQWEFINQYCTECHNFEDYSGGLDFTTMFVDEIPENAHVWEKAIQKLRGRMMPPPGQEKPGEETLFSFVSWLESYLDEASEVDPVYHGIPIHRLNRKEYANAIRDLTGIEINPADILPEDNSLEGFDNIAEALDVTPAFINQYVLAARSIMEQAIGDKTPSTGSTTYFPEEELPIRMQGGGSQQQHIAGLPLGTRGGMLIDHWFPADGEYAVNVGDFNLFAWMFNIEFENTMIVTVDGEKVYQTVLGGDNDRIALDLDQAAPMDDINGRTKNIPFTTTAGPHKVGVTFIRRTFAESDDRLEPPIPGTLQDRILSIPSVEIRGPFNPTGLSATPSRDKIFSCYPENTAQENDCAISLITDFATLAYRRPVTEEDMEPLLAFYEQGYGLGGFEEGVRRALTRTLASPNFLYRTQTTPANIAPGAIYALDDLELATRLSFFLWSSIPDRELLDLAKAGQLSEPDVMNQQIDRMIADPRSSILASNFAYQWLGLSKLDEINPDGAIYPYAYGAGDLRPDFKVELELFIDSLIKDDRSVIDLLDANFSYLNERLALHYGINTVKGNRFRRVELQDSTRWGLMGKGGILMSSAYPNRTSPVLRGAWILENIMGTPPPVPPPNVEDLPENVAGEAATTVRERLEQHRANPTCNACHAVMDPLGFALENFDAVGHWREIDRFSRDPIDSSGVLPSGAPVNGPDDLRESLIADPAMFSRTVTTRLMTFALGRPVEASDMPLVRSLVQNAATEEYRFSSLIKGIVSSAAFKYNIAPSSEQDHLVAEN